MGTVTVRLVVACECGRFDDREPPYTCICGREHLALADVVPDQPLTPSR